MIIVVVVIIIIIIITLLTCYYYYYYYYHRCYHYYICSLVIISIRLLLLFLIFLLRPSDCGPPQSLHFVVRCGHRLLHGHSFHLDYLDIDPARIQAECLQVRPKRIEQKQKGEKKKNLHLFLFFTKIPCR